MAVLKRDSDAKLVCFSETGNLGIAYILFCFTYNTARGRVVFASVCLKVRNIHFDFLYIPITSSGVMVPVMTMRLNSFLPIVRMKYELTPL